MTVLVVFGVLLTVGVPLFQNTVKNARMGTEITAIRATLNTARSEAMARRMPVVVCSSTNLTACSGSNDWDAGYIAFADEDGDGVVDSGEDVFLALALELPNIVNFRFTDEGGTADDATGFSSRGDSLGGSGTFIICDDRGADEARVLILGPSGAARGAPDPEEDEILNDIEGDNVTCS